jgi:hypothetical protein
MSRVLVIPDLHAPFTHPKFLDFVRRVQKDYRTNRTVIIGDEADHHAMSFHEHDPDGQSAGDEYSRAKVILHEWKRAFPTASICIGNHTKLPYRQASANGISRAWLKSYNEAWQIDSRWQWGRCWEIDGVLYTHGTGFSGAAGHRNAALKRRQSTVIGHIHSHAGIAFLASERDLIFGMNVGCGIDADAYAMAYGIDFPEKPILSCGVVINGREPHVVPMDLGSRYPRN